MAKDDEMDQLLDRMIKGKTPEQVLGESGLLKDLTKRLVEWMLNGELTEHLGYTPHAAEGRGTGNSRNGSTPKRVLTDGGALELDVPRDRAGEFEPHVAKKGQRPLPGFDEKVIALYARGLSTRDIQGHLEDVYGVEVSPSLVSTVTDGSSTTYAPGRAGRWMRPIRSCTWMRPISRSSRSRTGTPSARCCTWRSRRHRSAERDPWPTVRPRSTTSRCCSPAGWRCADEATYTKWLTHPGQATLEYAAPLPPSGFFPPHTLPGCAAYPCWPAHSLHHSSRGGHMHRPHRIAFLISLVAGCIALATPAQAVLSEKPVTEQECGTIIKPGQVPMLNRMDAILRLRRPQILRATRCLPLKIHIVRASDHTGGISVAQVEQGIADANAAYAPMNTSFYRLAAIDYIDNDAYYDHALTDPEVDALKGINWVAQAINCYFVPQLEFCGVANFPGDAVQGIVFNNDCVGLSSNPSTVPHEIGHYLGLYHTHETMFGAELVNGSNCTSAGDKFCDTPADPRLNNIGFMGPGCTYTGTVMDANGDSYHPDTHQYMSYSDKTCRTVFSPQSQAKVLAVLGSTRADHLNCPPIANAGGNRTVECTSHTLTAVTLNGSASNDPDGTPVTFQWSAPGVTFDDPTSATPTGQFHEGTTLVTLTVSSDGADVKTTAQVTVADTQPPLTSCPGDLTLQCDSHCDPSLGGVPASDAAVVAWLATFTSGDVCDPSPIVSLLSPACFPFGDTPVMFTVTDHSGNASSCTKIVHVMDTMPPTIAMSVDRTVLWPPNHKLVTINSAVTVTDVCDPHPTFQLMSITSNEPDNGLGDGDTPNDIQGASYGAADAQFLLRSERSGTGAGRKYTITYRAFDHSGNFADAVAVVRVPKDQSGAALAASGLNPNGSFVSGSATFAVVIPSLPRTTAQDNADSEDQSFLGPGTTRPGANELLFNARAVNELQAYVGNGAGVLSPVATARLDANNDGFSDLVCIYQVADAVALAAASTPEDGPLGLHYNTRLGAEYLVNSIAALGAPIVVPALGGNAITGGSATAAQGQPVANANQAPAGGVEAGPARTELAGVQPNPVNSEATVLFSLAQEGTVDLSVYDVRGARVRTLRSGMFRAGRYTVKWDERDDAGRRIGGGMYFVRLSAGRYAKTVKMVMMP